MRFLYGLIAMLAWSFLLQQLKVDGFIFDGEAVLISISIVAAGAMAGGA